MLGSSLPTWLARARLAVSIITAPPPSPAPLLPLRIGHKRLGVEGSPTDWTIGIESFPQPVDWSCSALWKSSDLVSPNSPFLWIFGRIIYWDRGNSATPVEDGSNSICIMLSHKYEGRSYEAFWWVSFRALTLDLIFVVDLGIGGFLIYVVGTSLSYVIWSRGVETHIFSYSRRRWVSWDD